MLLHVSQLILVQEALQEAKIAKIAEQITRDRKIKMVLIAGPSSSGKTTFCNRLSIQIAERILKLVKMFL